MGVPMDDDNNGARMLGFVFLSLPVVIALWFLVIWVLWH